MSRVRKPFVGLAAFLAGAYLVLAVFSMACAFDHAEPQASSHHHGSAMSHSSFCAWACQANPMSDAGPSALVPHPFFIVAPFVQSSHVVVSAECGFHADSRAPPFQS